MCTPDVEWVWSKLHLKGTKPAWIATIYRPPDGNVQNLIDLFENNIIDISSEGPCDILVLGDINIDVMKVRSMNARSYLNTIQNLGLQKLINKPTRVTLNTTTLIDHVLVSNEELYHHAWVYNPGISDHAMTFLSRKKLKKPRGSTYVSCRSYRKYSPVAFQSDVDAIEWNEILECHDNNLAASRYRDKLMQVVDRCTCTYDQA